MANRTKTIQELNLEDDFLFGKVMSDNEICRKVLEKILNVPIKKVEFPVTQKNINTALDGGDILGNQLYYPSHGTGIPFPHRRGGGI